MAHPDISFDDVLLVAAAMTLLLAAAQDIAFRLVSNLLCAALLVLGIALRVQDGTLVPSAAVAAGVFAATVLCWLRGYLGGGDVKLLSAAALAVRVPDVGNFLICTALLGGVLSVLYLALSRFCTLPPPGLRPRTLLGRVMRVERWRLQRGTPLPYAVAIACGGVATLWMEG